SGQYADLPALISDIESGAPVPELIVVDPVEGGGEGGAAAARARARIKKKLPHNPCVTPPTHAVCKILLTPHEARITQLHELIMSNEAGAGRPMVYRPPQNFPHRESEVGYPSSFDVAI
uniref:hypothetical protein n=1 Tax=Nocardia brasiliensis TaxID=37326 RepID=UPI0024553689